MSFDPDALGHGPLDHGALDRGAPLIPATPTPPGHGTYGRGGRRACGSNAQRTWSCRLDGDPQAVVTARALATAVLLGWDAGLVEDVVLVTSELVTNASAHGAAPVTIALTVRTGPEPAIVIDVSDASPDLPVQHLPGEVGHFGLWIAEELARVTVHPSPPGKTVRATFDVIDAASVPGRL